MVLPKISEMFGDAEVPGEIKTAVKFGTLRG